MLTELALTNFQVFKERTVIPCSELCILVGPNSAGKSAVLDAHTALCEALGLKHGMSEGIRSSAPQKMADWCHRGPAATGEAEIEAEFYVDTGNLNLLSEYRDEWCQYIFFALHERSRGELRFDFPFNEGWRGTIRIELNFDTIAEPVRIKINNVLALEYGPDDESPTAESRLKLNPVAFGGFLEKACDLYGYDSQNSNSFECFALFKNGIFENFFYPTDGENGEYEKFLVLIANSLLQLVKEASGKFNAPAPDRSVLTSSLYLVQPGYPSLFAGPSSQLPVAPSSADLMIREICQSAVGKHSVPATPLPDNFLDTDQGYRLVTLEHFVQSIESGIKYAHKLREPLHHFINRHLRESLFIDRGYQISLEYCEICPSQSAAEKYLPEPIHTNSKNRPAAYLFNPHLIDNFGVRSRFADVGTGISCVIPVLYALHQKASFIPQPELHLHPALQAALGDVLTDRLSLGPCQHIIETHSENLILRLLRRIRETSAGRHPEGSPLRLKPEQVSLLYFDPQPDGTTKVKRIRISQDGDFIDRWPQGFFGERRRELFDE